MAQETVRCLKVMSTLTIGHYAGATAYQVIALQPSLIEQEDVTAAAKTMRSILSRSFMMPLLGLTSSVTSLILYVKLRGTSMHDSFWLVSGGTMLALMPYSMKFVGPINAQFRAEDPAPTFQDEDEKWHNLLSDWLTFHTPRTIISITLFSIGVYKLVK